MKPLTLITLALFVLFSAGCVTQSGAERRIEKHPDWYAALSDDEKLLVQGGLICEKMGKNGVFLAWGSPSSVAEGSANGHKVETWYYDGYEPSYHTGVSFGVGYGGRGHCDYGFGYSGRIYPFQYTDVHYHRVEAAKVKFVNGLVAEWQARR